MTLSLLAFFACQAPETHKPGGSAAPVDSGALVETGDSSSFDPDADGPLLPMTIAFKPDQAGIWAGNAEQLDPTYADLVVADQHDYVLEQGFDPSFVVLQRQHGAARRSDVEKSAKAFGVGYFFPGHWLYRAGVRADAASIGATEEITVPVESLGGGLASGDVVVLHAPGDWETAETAVVSAVDGANVTLLRGARLECTAYLSAVVDWTEIGGEVDLSPHYQLAASLDASGAEAVCDELSGAYTFNVSPVSPLRPGAAEIDTAIEAYARYQVHHLARASEIFGFDEIASPDADVLGTWGPLELAFSGVEYDAAFWGESKSCGSMDVDNDLVPDCGVVDGYQSWGRGAMLAMAGIRAYAAEVVEGGEDLRVVVDTDSPGAYRGMEHINGVEMEHFPSLEVEDFEERLSEGFRQLREAHASVLGFAPDREALSYAFTKEQTAAVECGAAESSGLYDNRSFRVGAAASTLLLLPHAHSGFGAGKCFGLFDWDEYAGGAGVPEAWLGRAATDLVRVEALGEAVALDLSLEVVGCEGGAKSTASVEGGVRLPLTVYPGDTGCLGDSPETVPRPGDLVLVGRLDAPLASPEWTVRFTVQASTTTTGGSRAFTEPLDGLISAPPRLVQVELRTEGSSPMSAATIPQHDGEAHTVSLSFLSEALGDQGVSELRLKLGEEPGEVTITDVELLPGTADRWYRVYEHGVVFLNGSREDWTVTIDDIPEAAPGFARLTGRVDPEVNRGGETSETVTIPAMDALFVRAGRGL